VYNHASAGYPCPFCLFLQGVEGGPVGSRQQDLVFCDHQVAAFVCLRQWPHNQGHVLVVPVAHWENIFDMPPALAQPIQHLARRVALAMKTAYGCDGVSTRQHNEPAGDQDVWHYHLHVFPRYPDDGLYLSRGKTMPAQQRAAYADRLRRALPAEVGP
jgi:histidine triad (HIT) family protein